MTMTDRVVVLAFTGDLETSVLVPWLAEQHEATVVTLTLDLGQGTDLRDVRDRALAIGAERAHVMDVREEFARSFVAPALPLGTDEPRVAALARPIVAKYVAQVAAIEGTATVAHGSRSAWPIDGPLRVLAPCRDWGLSPEEVVGYARDRGIPISAAAQFAAVRTLWGRAITGELLNDPWAEVPSADFILTRSVTDWPKSPATVDLAFENGLPTSLNGVAMPLVELFSSLETIVGAHGLGRLDFPAIVGVRPRIVEEAPAPVVLHQAMKALSAVVPAMWPVVQGTVRLKILMGESRVEEVGI
jgi:argininosuccinate synthase